MTNSSLLPLSTKYPSTNIYFSTVISRKMGTMSNVRFTLEKQLALSSHCLIYALCTEIKKKNVNWHLLSSISSPTSLTSLILAVTWGQFYHQTWLRRHSSLDVTISGHTASLRQAGVRQFPVCLSIVCLYKVHQKITKPVCRSQTTVSIVLESFGSRIFSFLTLACLPYFWVMNDTQKLFPYHRKISTISANGISDLAWQLGVWSECLAQKYLLIENVPY